MIQTGSYRRYSLATATVLILLVAAIASVTYRVDPYWLYQDLDDANRNSAFDLFYHLRLHKPYALQNLEPRQLVIGTSRTAALPPGKLGDASYNASLPGMGLVEMHRMLEHAGAIAPLEEVYLGVGFPMFRDDHTSPNLVYVDERLMHSSPTLSQRLSRAYQVFRDRWSSLLSVSALRDTLAVLRGVRESPRVFNADGTWNIEHEAKNRARYFSMMVRRTASDFAGAGPGLKLDTYRALMADLDKAGVATTLIILPYHGSAMTAVDRVGGWPLYLEWQRQLVNVTSREFPNVRIYGLELNQSGIYEATDVDHPFFIDGIHLSGEAGAQVVACLSESPECRNELQLVRLTERNIDAYLEDVDEVKEGFALANPETYRKVLVWLERSGR